MIFSSASFIQNIMLTSNFLVPLIVTAAAMPDFIRKLTENNIVAKDVYKKFLTIADREGLNLIAMLSLSMNSFFKFNPQTMLR